MPAYRFSIHSGARIDHSEVVEADDEDQAKEAALLVVSLFIDGLVRPPQESQAWRVEVADSNGGSVMSFIVETSNKPATIH